MSDTERDHKSDRGALHEEEAMRTCDEDKRLRNDSNLQVNDGVKLRVIGARGINFAIERDAKLVIEEAGLHYDGNEGDAKDSQ